MEVNIHHAKTHLSRLIAAAESAEEVIMARDGKPAVKLVPAQPKQSRKDLFGAWEGLVSLPTPEEWQAMDNEIADQMLNATLFPDPAK